MKTKLTVSILIVLLAAPLVSFAAEKDRTKYDCRETVKVRTVFRPGTKIRVPQFVKKCPHIEQQKAGQCETHWLWGMRCKS